MEAHGTSCLKCSHARVCTVYRAVTKLIEQGFTGDTKPLDADDLAKICKEFVSAKVVEYARAE